MRGARLLLLGLPLAALGCETIIGADFGAARRAPASAVCRPSQPPERPADLSPATDTVDFTVVVRSLDLGDGVQAVPVAP